jgi:hypothetical protein
MASVDNTENNTAATTSVQRPLRKCAHIVPGERTNVRAQCTRLCIKYVRVYWQCIVITRLRATRTRIYIFKCAGLTSASPVARSTYADSQQSSEPEDDSDIDDTLLVQAIAGDSQAVLAVSGVYHLLTRHDARVYTCMFCVAITCARTTRRWPCYAIVSRQTTCHRHLRHRRPMTNRTQPTTTTRM